MERANFKYQRLMEDDNGLATVDRRQVKPTGKAMEDAFAKENRFKEG